MTNKPKQQTSIVRIAIFACAALFLIVIIGYISKTANRNNLNANQLSPSPESGNKEQLKEDAKFKKNSGKTQVACAVVDNHQGKKFTLEVFPSGQDETPANAAILDSHNKILQNLALEGPYDSVSSPGDKVFNATVPFEKVSAFVSVRVSMKNKSGETVTENVKFDSCIQGIE